MVSDKNKKLVKGVMRVMELVSPEHNSVANIASIIGYENAMKLMKYFSGETITFPSERSSLEDSKYIEAYVRYKLMGEPWESMLVEVYGEGNMDLEVRRATKGRLRTLESRLKNYRAELEAITLSDIEAYRDLIEQEVGDEY